LTPEERLEAVDAPIPLNRDEVSHGVRTRRPD